MTAFNALVKKLMKSPYPDSQNARKSFIADPQTAMTGLTDAEKALLCSMREEEIRRAAEVDPVAMHDFVEYMKSEHIWDPVGDFEKDYFDDNSACQPRARAAGDVGARWSRPEHRIISTWNWKGKISRTLYKAFSDANDVNELVVLGEGFLPGAHLTLISQSSGLVEYQADFPKDAAHYHCCSIRQVYMKASFMLPNTTPVGGYNMFIRNVGWSQTPTHGVDYQMYVDAGPPT
jgi:hypothetical protein